MRGSSTDFSPIIFYMRSLFVLSLCFACATSQAQTVDSKVGLQTMYMPQFKVQEASESNVQALGIRWMLADYDFAPIEFGFHGSARYGDVARISLGFNLAYLLAELRNHDFKIGLGLNRIDLEAYEANKEELGPHAGDVSFTGWGTQFKPYIEWEWTFSPFSSLFLQASYHIINGEKSEVTSVEATGDPIIKNRITGRDESFFYSLSGFDVGIGISVIF